jgi:large subunit ribosomal protein L15
MSKTNTKKFRGSRTCGGGTSKNRRGAGNRGGRGKCGGCKHHFVRALQLGYAYGRHGFKRPLKMIRDVAVVNVGELDELANQLVEDEFAQLEDVTYHLDLACLGIEKVLGTGQVKKNLVVKAADFSVIAQNKIESAGGTCIKIEE